MQEGKSQAAAPVAAPRERPAIQAEAQALGGAAAALAHAAFSPGALRPADVLRLQRALGNRAVGRLLHAGAAQRRALTEGERGAFIVDPAGRALADWQSIGDDVAGTPDLVAFARIPGWGVAAVRRLAVAFGINPNGLSAARWASLAGRVPADDDPAAVAFARLAGWTANDAARLATAYGTDRGGRAVADWVSVAAAVPDNADAAAALARVPRWTPARLATLAGSYAAGAVNGLTGAETASIARLLPNHADGPAAVVRLSAVADIATHGLAAVTDLAARVGATPLGIATVLESAAIAAYTWTQTNTLLATHLPGLSLPLVIRRLDVHGLPAVGAHGVAGVLQGMTTDMGRLDQALQARHGMPQPRRDEVKAAYRMRNWAIADILAFLRVASVRNALGNGAATNPAHWLYQLAREHQGPLGAGDNTVRDQVRAPPDRINVKNWIIHHVCDRHTFRHFDFAGIANVNTMLEPDRGAAAVRAEIVRVASLPALLNARLQWNGQPIQLGSYQVRVAQDPNSLADFILTQFFFEQAAGTPIPGTALTAMHDNNLF
ncbi:MAG: hypothetical protein JWM27_1007 [Gemmatimonadetes bacterium]|nr:hypothetical protein [Gemmatimonadota bacterium]